MDGLPIFVETQAPLTAIPDEMGERLLRALRTPFALTVVTLSRRLYFGAYCGGGASPSGRGDACRFRAARGRPSPHPPVRTGGQPHPAVEAEEGGGHRGGDRGEPVLGTEDAMLDP